MKIDEEKIRKICAGRNMSIKNLLEQTGVSKNAFYSLARKRNILPRSVNTIANTLNVSASEILSAEPSPFEKARILDRKIQSAMHHNKHADPDNIRHTLLLLNEKPVDRLRRALTRAQKFDFR